MLIVTSTYPGTETETGPRSFAVVVCRADEPSERGRTMPTKHQPEGNAPGRCRPKSDEIEVYDLTYAGRPGFHPHLGQFIGGWGLDNTAGLGSWPMLADGQGWDLCGNVDAWTLDADAKVQVMLFAARNLRGPDADCAICGRDADAHATVEDPNDVLDVCWDCHASIEANQGKVTADRDDRGRRLSAVDPANEAPGACGHRVPFGNVDDEGRCDRCC